MILSLCGLSHHCDITFFASSLQRGTRTFHYVDAINCDAMTASVDIAMHIKGNSNAMKPIVGGNGEGKRGDMIEECEGTAKERKK